MSQEMLNVNELQSILPIFYVICIFMFILVVLSCQCQQCQTVNEVCHALLTRRKQGDLCCAWSSCLSNIFQITY